MKIKFAGLFSIFLVLYSLNLFSQRSINDCKPTAFNQHITVKSPTDTLRPPSFSTGTPTLYKFIDGGYSFGTSKLGDRAFAQVYKVTTSYMVDGVALWMGAKQQIGAADTLNVIIYKLDGPGTATDTSGIVYVNNAPDSTDHLLQITTNLIDTVGLTFLTFPTPYIAYVDYAAGIEFSQINDDTVGLVTTKLGDADSTQLSWDKWSDGTWNTVLEPLNWGYDLDLGIFMIVDKSAANVTDNYFIDGIKLSQNQPNPASSTTMVQYAIENNGKVSLEIYDATGRLVLRYNEGEQLAGSHNIYIDSDKLNNGTYYYSLKADNRRLTKKMTILK